MIFQQVFTKKHQTLYWFALICLISIFLSFILNEFVITDTVFYNSYADRLNIERINELSKLISKIKWISYLLSPVGYFIKFLFITLILLIGDVLLDTKIGFKKLFFAVILSESIFLTQEAIRVFWFLFIDKPETISDVGKFDILSIYSLVESQNIYSWLVYPFKTANIYELIYWIFLAWIIKVLSKQNYETSLKLVLTTYVPALFIWVVFIMYLSI